MECRRLLFRYTKKLREKNRRIIRSAKNLHEIKITSEEYINKFLGEIKDKETKVLAISIFANRIIEMKSPLYTKEEADQNDIDLIEYKYKNQITLGFGAGDIFDTIVISFLTNEEWDNSIIKVQKESINNDGTIAIEEIEIKHAATLDNLDFHETFFNILTDNKYNICKDEFWSKKDMLFKKIKFCDEVENQVNDLSTEVYEVFINKLKLIELEIKGVESWNFSPESKATMDKYGYQRIFNHSDFKKSKIFENHIKSFPNNNRMYFFKKDDLIYIGYIGKHLKTVKNT